MPANFTKGPHAPADPAISADTAVPPPATGKAPATTLSGAFAAALGAKPQLGHPGGKAPLDGPGKRAPAQEPGAPRIRNITSAAPLTPRKGHR